MLKGDLLYADHSGATPHLAIETREIVHLRSIYVLPLSSIVLGMNPLMPTLKALPQHYRDS